MGYGREVDGFQDDIINGVFLGKCSIVCTKIIFNHRCYLSILYFQFNNNYYLIKVPYMYSVRVLSFSSSSILLRFISLQNNRCGSSDTATFFQSNS